MVLCFSAGLRVCCFPIGLRLLFFFVLLCKSTVHGASRFWLCQNLACALSEARKCSWGSTERGLPSAVLSNVYNHCFFILLTLCLAVHMYRAQRGKERPLAAPYGAPSRSVWPQANSVSDIKPKSLANHKPFRITPSTNAAAGRPAACLFRHVPYSPSWRFGIWRNARRCITFRFSRHQLITRLLVAIYLVTVHFIIILKLIRPENRRGEHAPLTRP